MENVFGYLGESDKMTQTQKDKLRIWRYFNFKKEHLDHQREPVKNRTFKPNMSPSSVSPDSTVWETILKFQNKLAAAQFNTTQSQ